MMAHTDDTDSQEVWGIGDLNAEIRATLAERFDQIWVAGEISDLSRPRSGHLYFTLKEADAQLKAVIWRSAASRLRVDLDDGMSVLCRGRIDVYAARGTYQLVVQQVQPQGEGALQQALRKLRERLAAEGLFDADRKRTLPIFPRRLAVVTSPSGAALKDFLEVVRRRWPQLEITVVPCRVQGDGAAQEIASAISDAHRLQPAPDVLLVTRGGGSLEDLWAFNEEVLVRAIAAARIPVVSAVGHEIDVTLADLVADRRALTPTEAGELVVPDLRETTHRLQDARERIRVTMQSRLQHAGSQLKMFSEHRIFRDPFRLLDDARRSIDLQQQALSDAAWRSWNNKRHEMRLRGAELEAMSPLKTLARGYAVLQDAAGQVVRSAEHVNDGERLDATLSFGTLRMEVRERHIHSIESPTDAIRAMAQNTAAKKTASPNRPNTGQ